MTKVSSAACSANSRATQQLPETRCSPPRLTCAVCPELTAESFTVGRKQPFIKTVAAGAAAASSHSTSTNWTGDRSCIKREGWSLGGLSDSRKLRLTPATRVTRATR